MALQKALAVQTEQLSPTLKAIEELRQSSALARLTEEMNRHQDLMKRLCQPMDDLQRLTRSGVWAELERVRAASELWQQRFRMPEMEELTRTLARYRESPIAKMLAEQVQAPCRRRWRRCARPGSTDPARSMSAFSELQRLSNH